MLIAASLFYSWNVLPHPSVSGSKLCPHGSIMEIFLCPDLFPLCITSPVLWAHIFAKLNYTSVYCIIWFYNTLSSSQPFPKGQGQAEGELLNRYCCGLNVLWNCTSDFLCRPTDLCVDYFSASFLVAVFASPNTDLTSTSKYSRAWVQLAWEFLFTLFAAIHVLWTCLLLKSQEAWLWWE